MEAVILWQFCILVTIHTGIAIALYHLAERRLGTGATWAFIGLLFSVFGLLVFFLYIFWAESMERIRERGEFRRIDQFMQARRKEAQSMDHLEHSAHVDHYLDELVNTRQFEAARAHVGEKLRQAHEQGDKPSEEACRRMLEELEDLPQS